MHDASLKRLVTSVEDKRAVTRNTDDSEQENLKQIVNALRVKVDGYAQGVQEDRVWDYERHSSVDCRSLHANCVFWVRIILSQPTTEG